MKWSFIKPFLSGVGTCISQLWLWTLRRINTELLRSFHGKLLGPSSRRFLSECLQCIVSVAMMNPRAARGCLQTLTHFVIYRCAFLMNNEERKLVKWCLPVLGGGFLSACRSGLPVGISGGRLETPGEGVGESVGLNCSRGNGKTSRRGCLWWR